MARLDRPSLNDRLDELAALLEQDLPLAICAERMGYWNKTSVYNLFAEMKRRLGPQAR